MAYNINEYILFQFQHSKVLQVVKVPIDDNSVLAHQCDIVSPCALGNVSLYNLFDQIHNVGNVINEMKC